MKVMRHFTSFIAATVAVALNVCGASDESGGIIRHDGNVLLIIASTALAMMIGGAVVVLACRMRGAPPHIRVRRSQVAIPPSVSKTLIDDSIETNIIP